MSGSGVRHSTALTLIMCCLVPDVEPMDLDKAEWSLSIQFLKENGVPIGEALTAAYESNPFAATTPDMRYKELGGQLRGFQDRIRSTYKREPCPEDLDKNLRAMYKEYHELKVELGR